MIHPSAIVDEGAELADGVSIGPFSIIGCDVRIAAGTTIGPHVVIKGPTRIGRDNRIGISAVAIVAINLLGAQLNTRQKHYQKDYFKIHTTQFFHLKTQFQCICSI